MKSKTSKRFRAAVKTLPESIQKQARESYRLFRQIPPERIYSVRVGLHYRALGRWIGGEIVWFWIGSHAEYDKFL